MLYHTLGKRDIEMALYVRDCFDFIELNDCDDKVECLWVKTRGKTNEAEILLGVCYRPPNQDEEVCEVFYKQLTEVSQSLALVLCKMNRREDDCHDFRFCDCYL